MMKRKQAELPLDVPDVIRAIRASSSLPEAQRIALYNQATRELAALVADVVPDPVCGLQLLPAADITANDYNPNRVASTELDLLETSIRADGITMPIVVIREGSRAIVIDGFHRRRVVTERLGRRYIPCTVLDRPLVDRMASTVRHNRARGKHAVDLMGTLVRGMLAEGWDDGRIAAALGMSEEELLRLKQSVGCARLLAGPEYGCSWTGRDGDAK
jgi:hypothetical protein